MHLQLGSVHMQTLIQSPVDEILEKGIVEVPSPWAAVVVMVRKKDGMWRFCVDYRGLDAVSVKDAHPLPRTDNTLDALRGSSVFSTMDLSSGLLASATGGARQSKDSFLQRQRTLSVSCDAHGLGKCTPPLFNI